MSSEVLKQALRRSEKKAASESIVALLERFEDAVREDEMKGAYDPISRHLIEQEYELSKLLLLTALKGGA